MDNVIDQLSVTIASAKTLEDLTRPILEMMQSLLGLESAYLTTIDLQAQVQQILHARNAGAITIPEGLSVPWEETLCKRALDDDQWFSNDVGHRWPECTAARALGIQTYLSTPVRLADGALYGTLCTVSASRMELPPKARELLTLFAALIAQQVEREQLMQQLLHANARLTALATTDPLTQLANRRALRQELERLLALGVRQRSSVLVAFVDLDGFKGINDHHGHETGDLFLVALADRLRAVLRKEDLAARWGGDEFVVIGLGPDRPDELAAAQAAFQDRVLQATVGRYRLDRLELDYPGASVGVIGVLPGTRDADEALQSADAAMYEIKQARRGLAGAAPR